MKVGATITVGSFLLFFAVACHSFKVTLFSGRNYSGSSRAFNVPPGGCANVDFWFEARSMDLKKGCVVLFKAKNCSADLGAVPYFEGRPYLPLMDRKVGSIGGCRKFFRSWIRDVGPAPAH